MNNQYFDPPENSDYSNYDDQLFHIPGHIQPHGVIFALQEPDLKILQISENTNQFLGIPAESLLGKDLTCLFSPEKLELITEQFLLFFMSALIISFGLDQSKFKL
ncbi:hypothetical protein [Trichormus variabilis]|uniref:hypothetical protein n=1 Tax=Anabaena variabilis TaxID=264691 RepID=UPI0016899BF3|nr:hypothetical protein [Trichormus variabilis]MBD2629062.1 hypothetical protein [Trichormus variabilis FACHB-164]